MTEVETKEYMDSLNKFFDSINKCDKHMVCHSGNCVYLGTIEERIARYHRQQNGEPDSEDIDTESDRSESETESDLEGFIVKDDNGFYDTDEQYTITSGDDDK